MTHLCKGGTLGCQQASQDISEETPVPVEKGMGRDPIQETRRMSQVTTSQESRLNVKKKLLYQNAFFGGNAFLNM